MKRTAVAGITLVAVTLLALSLGAPGQSVRADTDNTTAVSCLFLLNVIDGDPDDFPQGADFTAACDGLDATDTANMGDAAGDEDGVFEPGDLDQWDLEANQITEASQASSSILTKIYIVAFVDNDGPVTFDADPGVNVTINDDGSLDDPFPADDGNPETCDGDDDADCGLNILADGDGVVVATVTATSANAGDDIDVSVEQDAAGVTEKIHVVGQPDEIALTLLEPRIQSGASPDCRDGDPGVLDPDALSSTTSTIAVAVVTDSDNTPLTRIAANIFSGDVDIAEVGDNTGVTVDTGEHGMGSMAVICGVDAGSTSIEVDIGIENDSVPITVADILESGPPDSIEFRASPRQIDCTGVQESFIEVRLRDAFNQFVADGFSVQFSIEGEGTGSVLPHEATTVGGQVNAVAKFDAPSAASFEVRAVAGDISGTITIACGGAVECYPMSPPCASSPPLCEWPLSPPNCGPDTDGDGVPDDAEFWYDTEPDDPDSDDDSFLDRPQLLHLGENTDQLRDNCPSIHNSPQLNTDGNFINYFSLKVFNDVTAPVSDAAGNACDTDDDNDGIADADEANGFDCGAATNSVTDPLDADSDEDLVLDYAECILGTDPNDINSVPPIGACVAAGDNDGDRMLDSREFCFYGTSANFTDSDNDGCTDGAEIASVNGDTKVDSLDLAQIAQTFNAIGYTVPAAPHIVQFDVNRDRKITSIDLSLIAQQFNALRCM